MDVSHHFHSQCGYEDKHVHMNANLYDVGLTELPGGPKVTYK